MKTPEEIKTALKALIPIDPNAGEIVMTPFQYFELARIHIAAHKYILHLEKKYDEVFRLCGDLHHDMLEQRERGDRLEAERDAAVRDMTEIVQEYGEPCCDYCGADFKPNCTGRCWTHNEGFKWRGVQKEE